MAGFGGPKSIGGRLLKGLGPVLRRQGFAISEILTRWPQLVGTALAQQTAPERLQFPPGRNGDAVLHVRVAPGFGPDVQMLAPLMIERLNQYYGYKAIGRLALHQGPLPQPTAKKAPAPRALSPEEAARIEALAQPIRDPALRDSILRLGASLMTGPLPKR